jgi:hypothetical protein
VPGAKATEAVLKAGLPADVDRALQDGLRGLGEERTARRAEIEDW